MFYFDMNLYFLVDMSKYARFFSKRFGTDGA